jgi:hypothetical protein
MICGQNLAIGDHICFRLVEQERDGKMEEAIQAVCLLDGMETCIVGYLPRHIVHTRRDKFIEKDAKIIELYENSDNPVKRRKSNQNFGIASFVFLLQE